jgi:hypothetical protein
MHAHAAGGRNRASSTDLLGGSAAHQCSASRAADAVRIPAALAESMHVHR